MTSVLQLTDTDFAFPLKAAARRRESLSLTCVQFSFALLCSAMLLCSASLCFALLCLLACVRIACELYEH